MLKNLEKQQGDVTFKAPLVVTAPTYNIIDELKEEGDWDVLQVLRIRIRRRRPQNLGAH